MSLLCFFLTIENKTLQSEFSRKNGMITCERLLWNPSLARLTDLTDLDLRENAFTCSQALQRVL